VIGDSLGAVLTTTGGEGGRASGSTGAGACALTFGGGAFGGGGFSS
jgi:hypothetical protein